LPSNSKASSPRSKAKASGFAEKTHPYHVRTGNWIREHRGVYRFAHYNDLPSSEVQTGPGYKYTRPLRRILDLIEAGTVERTFIRQALRQAIDRGLITRQQLPSADLSETARKIVGETLRRAT
jgi:hypothetical protein